jgi:hypothetical protein
VEWGEGEGEEGARENQRTTAASQRRLYRRMHQRLIENEAFGEACGASRLIENGTCGDERPIEGGTRSADNGCSRFAGVLYEYHRYGGYHAAICQRFQRGFATLVVLAWIAFVLCFVDWHAVALCVHESDCAVVRFHTPNTPAAVLLFVSICGGAVVARYTAFELGMCRRARVVYNHELGVPDAALHALTWECIVARFASLAPSQRPFAGCGDQYTTQLIMRDWNYFTMLATSESLPVGTFSLPTCLILYILVWKPLCGESRVDDSALRDAKHLQQLKVRAVAAGILLSPLLCTWMALFHVIDNIRAQTACDGALFHNVFSRSVQARLRHFNELPHAFHARISRATLLANRYMDAFPDPWSTAILRSAAFVIGGAMALIVLIGFVNEDCLSVAHLWNYNLVWWLALCTAIINSRGPARETGDGNRSDSQELLRLLESCTHREVGTYDLRRLRKLMRPKWVHLLMEMAECFLSPLRIYRIDFEAVATLVLNKTFHVPGLGDLCVCGRYDASALDEKDPVSLRDKVQRSWSSFAWDSVDCSITELDKLERTYPL